MNTSENIININLKEYFWSLLEQWKCILIAGLVFAMLVPAALAFKNYKEDLDAKNDRDSLSAMSYEDLLNTLNEGDREEVLNAAYQAKLIRDQEEYNATSIFAGMNSEKLPVLHYAWTIDDSYDVEQIAAAYVAALGDSETVDVVRQNLGDEYKEADDMYIRELIIASSDGAVDLKVVLPEGTDVDALNAGIMARLFEIHNQIDGNARKHTVTYIVSEKQDIAYAELAGELIARNNDLVLLQENYDSLVLSMSDYQRNVLNVLNDKDKNADAEQSMPEFEFSKGNIVIGFAVGVFLYAFIYLVLIVFSSKVQNPELFSETFKTRNLGRISSYRYKGLSAFIHGKKFYQIHRKNSMDDAAVNAATDAVIAACANKDLHKTGVILAGDMKAYSAQCDKVIKKLKSSSKTDVVKIAELNDSALENLDSVVICAGSGKSKYGEINGIMRLCNYYKKEIIGGIYFD